MKYKSRFEELDALRGLAALSVMLYHYTTLYSKFASREYVSFINFKYGGFGVELFFIISGFVIYMTIIKCSSAIEFSLKRIIRLYPVYIASVLITFFFTNLYYLEDIKVSSKDFLINLTMLQNIIPGYYVKNVDGSYWTLAI